MDTYGIQNEIALSEAKGMLEKAEYIDGADIDTHIQDLRTTPGNTGLNPQFSV